MNRAVFSKPTRRKPRSYGSGGYPSGIVKPCPTCYGPMELLGRKDNVLTGRAWACAKHGAPSKP